VQVGLNEGHNSAALNTWTGCAPGCARLPQVSAYFQTGGLGGCHLNQGVPAPLDIQVSGMDMNAAHAIASQIAQQARALPGVSDVLVPQDVDYPALKIDIDRERASELGLSAKEVVDSSSPR
jgi:hydrophobic/amphiphilic exporter-1 (mainly G- bacteria), HAE1 family